MELDKSMCTSIEFVGKLFNGSSSSSICNGRVFRAALSSRHVSKREKVKVASAALYSVCGDLYHLLLVSRRRLFFETSLNGASSRQQVHTHNYCCIYKIVI